MTRSSGNWQRPPGGFDVLNIRRRHYPATNPWGFPDLLPQRFILPDNPQPLSYRERDDSGIPCTELKPDGLRLRKMT